MEEVEEAEARTPLVARRPQAPTKAEVDAHFPLHAEYRDWCPHCVAGKGMSTQHRHDKGKDEPIGTTVSMDYLFMIPEEEDEGMDAVLILYDSNRKGIWTMSVDKKGATPSSVKWVTDKLEEIGYSGSEVTLKSDQEPAILDLKREVGIKRQRETVMIESPVRESKSNGAVERAVKTWASQFRTLRHQLEARLGTKIRKGSSMMSWLVAFTSEVLSKYKVHANGRTTYEMTTGHRCKIPACGFGEKVNFKTTTYKTRKNKMDTEWDVGYFLGWKSRTTEYLVGTSEGIISCTTMRRLQDDLAYDKACLDEINVGYRDFVCKGAMSENPRVRMAVPMPENRDQAPITGQSVPRRMRIAPRDLHEHGYTIGCPGCEAVQSGKDLKRNHTEDCRKRIEAEVERTEEGQARLGKAKARIDEWVVDASKDEVKVAPAEETPNSGGAAGSAGPQEMQTENFDIATPMQGRSEAGSPEKQRMNMEDAEVELEDGIARGRDVRMNTPERAPPVKRRADEDGMPIDDESLKARRLTDDARMGMSST